MLSHLQRSAPATMEENPLWLVVLCDLMTNLMLFFLIMFIWYRSDDSQRKLIAQSFRVDGVIEAPAPPETQVELIPEVTAEALTSLVEKAGLKGQIDVVEVEDAVRLRLVEDVLFLSAKSQLADTAELSLTGLADILKQMPNEIIVEGHTDTVPISSGDFETNWELSVARAYAVMERLMLSGVAPKRLVAAGYGEHKPIASNGTREGRAQNRRVEILILRSGKDLR